MNTAKYVCWQDAETWLGYLEVYPDYRSQGETKEELEENLRDIYGELTRGRIPCLNTVDQLDVTKREPT